MVIIKEKTNGTLQEVFDVKSLSISQFLDFIKKGRKGTRLQYTSTQGFSVTNISICDIFDLAIRNGALSLLVGRKVLEFNLKSICFIEEQPIGYNVSNFKLYFKDKSELAMELR